MNLQKIASQRSRLNINTDTANNMPLHSRVSVFSQLTRNSYSNTESINEFVCNARLYQSRVWDRSNISTPSMRALPKKSISYGMTVNSSIDEKMLLQLITHETADQLRIIIDKMSISKTKLYYYVSPEERFNKKREYILKADKPTKTQEQKMLKVQELIKAKIDEVIMFLYGILKDTGDELRSQRTFHNLELALDNIYKTKSDDFTILNMKAEGLCSQLFHDIRRIDREVERLVDVNRAIQTGFYAVQDRVFFLNMKKMNYAEKWERNRQWLHQYVCDKDRNNVCNYISDLEEKIDKDSEITEQITLFLQFDTQDLERKRDEFPEKLDRECDARIRVISQLKEEIGEMAIEKQRLITTIAERAQQIDEWKIYKEMKEAEEEELRRIAEKEELARQLEANRIAAELAAEEELLASFTSYEKLQYWKNKKDEAKKAAKAAKAAAKAAAKKAAKAEKKKRRTA